MTHRCGSCRQDEMVDDLTAENDDLRAVVEAFTTEFSIKFPPEYLEMYWPATFAALREADRE